MSDLLAPILYVMQNEVDAFWCFVGFMKRVQSNFDFDQGGMKNQLQQLIELVKTYDPEVRFLFVRYFSIFTIHFFCIYFQFYSYLDAKDSGNLYFCFRWLLIWFKREFPFSDVMRIWEVLWTDQPCPNFHLVVCLALMDLEKRTIVENNFGFTEILKHINDMANSNIPINDVLARYDFDSLDIFQRLQYISFTSIFRAEAIYKQMAKSPYVSNAARRVLNLPLITENQLKSASQAVPIQNGVSPRRRRHQSSGNSGESLNNSSSVEVLSEMDDEAKVENRLMAAGHF